VRQPITLTGTIAGPVAGPAGEKIGLTLETVIDRTSFGMDWNMELPGGGFILDNEVTLTANLELGKAQA
jgi:polyisoprenoid-binding protein YceI